MKKRIIFLFISVYLLTGCHNDTISKHTASLVNSQEYDFELLRDSLGLDSCCVFVKECSPLYMDSNPYGFDESSRIKTIFYQVFPPRYDYWDEPDTIIWAVKRNNNIIFWGRNEANSPASKLIEWTINNRTKI